MKPRHLLASLAIALAIGAWPIASRATPVLLDRVVATVEKRPIFRSDVLRRTRPFLAQLDRATREDSKVVSRISREIIAKMIDEVLIEMECERRGIRVEPQDIDHALDHLAQVNGVSREVLLAEAAKQGLPEQAYRAELRHQLLDAGWVARKIRPGIVAPLAGSDAEKARALAMRIESARKAELSRLRKRALVELRW